MRELVDQLLDEQRKRWNTGDRVTARELIERHPELASDSDLGADLAFQEYILAQQSGVALEFDELVARYPEFENALLLLKEMDELQASPPLQCARRFGEHEILFEIARGGMGIVYKARHIGLDREVALKVIRADVFADATDVERFHAEARAAARLRHPRIVAIHDVGTVAGKAYYTMDFIDGRSLAAIVREDPVDPKRAARYLVEIIEAVAFAHAHQTLHRDLKPSNVLIDKFDQVFVTDFGLAKRVDEDSGITRTGQILGTPSYMPPEQAEGRNAEVGPTGDVYSLGAMLYEMLTGRPPFRAATALETLQQVIKTEPVGPRRLNPAIPRDLETICLTCLRKEPGKRYPSATALGDDLCRVLTLRPIHARRAGSVERTVRWCRRNRAVSALLLGLAIALGFAGWQWSRTIAKAAEVEKERDIARSEGQRATRSLNLAQDAVRRMLTRVAVEKLADVPQMELVRRELLEDALEFYETFLAEHQDDPSVRMESANAQFQVGTVREQLGDLDQAEAAYRQSAAQFLQLQAVTPEDRQARIGESQALMNLALVLSKRGRHEEADTVFGRVEDTAQQIHSTSANDHRLQLSRAALYLNRAHLLSTAGRHAESLPNVRRAIEIHEALGDTPAQSPDVRRALATCYNLLGTALKRTGMGAEAYDAYAKSIEQFQLVSDASPTDRDLQMRLGTSHRNLASLCLAMEFNERALHHYQQARVRFEPLAHDSPNVPQLHYELGVSLAGEGGCLLDTGKPVDSLEPLLQSTVVLRRALELEPANPLHAKALEKPLFLLCLALIETLDHAQAASASRELAHHSQTALEYGHAARVHATCVLLASRDAQLDEALRTETARTYAESGLEFANAAIERGYVADGDFMESLSPWPPWSEVIRILSEFNRTDSF